MPFSFWLVVIPLSFIVTLSACSEKHCGDSAGASKKPRGSSDVTEITTPNGKRGVYCKDMATVTGKSDRLKCYQFVSQICTAGYDFIRENDDAAMIECKPTSFE